MKSCWAIIPWGKERLREKFWQSLVETLRGSFLHKLSLCRNLEQRHKICRMSTFHSHSLHHSNAGLKVRFRVLCFEISPPSLFSPSPLWSAIFKTKHAENLWPNKYLQLRRCKGNVFAKGVSVRPPPGTRWMNLVKMRTEKGSYFRTTFPSFYY